MRNQTELLYRVGKANVISIIDLKSGYYQIPMEEKSKHLTAFNSGFGIFVWNVMPFGLKNAPATFQRYMDSIFEGIDFVVVCIDDIAIFSKTLKEHKNHVITVFKILAKHNMTINPLKCQFGLSTIRFLGHMVGSGSHGPDPEKISAIKGLKEPTSVKQVKSVLGLMNYYAKYIDKFAEDAVPLYKLTSKKIKKFEVTKPAKIAFVTLKDKLCHATQLKTPDINKPFTIYTDASDIAVSGCLSQTDETGEEFPIAFTSAKLNQTQQNWSTIEKESFAVIHSLKKFDSLVFGCQITIYTDHSPLTFLKQSTPPNPKLVRWALSLERYNLILKHRKGSENINADSLTRIPNEVWN